MIIDRIIGFLGLFVLLKIGTPYLLEIAQHGVILTTLLIFVFVIVAAISVSIRLDLLSHALIKLPYFSKWICSLGHLVSFLKRIEQCAAYTRTLLQKWLVGYIVLFLSLANQTILGLIVFLLARSLGNHLELYVAVFVFPFVLMLYMIPISLAGWGLREGAMFVVFALLGMPSEIALGVSILFGTWLLLSSLPGACL